ncbi:MAG: YvcK family protein [Candidatus Aureabacteria bacterium]|nr:YvcK family protein [Candidatus Auribacterota bacterium]
MRFFKWLIPGLKVKRWFVIHLAALVLLILASHYVLSENKLRLQLAGFLLLAFLFYAYSFHLLYRRFMKVHKIEDKKNIVDILYDEQKLSKGPKIVAIGGGTGLSTLLAGLKTFTHNITAVVTVSDDGGSSGILRESYDVLPPGDMRNCLVALADSEPLMRKLFQYRFPEQKPLSGHTVGNLVILALRNILGNFETALRETSKILAIKGKVVPASLTKIKLVSENTDGSYTEGEHKITKSVNKIEKIHIFPEDATSSSEAIEAITSCDAVIIGPGSLYTSIMPNLLIHGIKDAIIKTPCKKVYICNVMTQEGETDQYTAYDHIQAIEKHCKGKIFDTVIVNSSQIDPAVLERYRQENSFPVVVDENNIIRNEYRLIKADVINVQNVVRHNSEKLAQVICSIISQQ